MRWLGLLAVVVVLGACPKPPTPPPVNPADADAGPAPAPDCGAACGNEKRLGCAAAVSCADICPRLVTNHGDYVVCVMQATSCDAVNACHVVASGDQTHGLGGGRSGP